MNKRNCLILLMLICRICDAQILCIYCYDQNDTISANVNNLILNGGFENTNCIPNDATGSFCPNSLLIHCNILNWTCSGGGINTYAKILDYTDCLVIQGSYAAYFGNWMCNPCSQIDNDTTCLTDSLCTLYPLYLGYPYSRYPGYGDYTGVSLEQTVSGLIIGNPYTLEFWTGGEWNTNMPYGGIFAVDIGFGNTLLRSKSTDPFTNTIGTRYIIEFLAASSSHTIKFTNWGHVCDSCNELVLDDVRLYTQAELSSSVPHCTVGIDNSNFQNIKDIFPNPVTNTLNVKMNNNELLEIILYDITSKKLLQQQFINSISINTEQLAKGIYLYEVRNKNGVIKKGNVVKD